MLRSRGFVEEQAKQIDDNPHALFNTVTINDRVRTASALSSHMLFENRQPRHVMRMPDNQKFMCYMCKQPTRMAHGFYSLCCDKCGKKNLNMFYEQHDPEVTSHVKGRIAMVTGGRTKIGYQTALRLLRAGAKVMVTTRFPSRALEQYYHEVDCDLWKENLIVGRLDLNEPSDNVVQDLAELRDRICKCFQTDHLDILINVAAQTIRGIERHAPDAQMGENRYGDARYFPSELAAENSWGLQLGQIDPEEMNEVMRINAIGPFLIFQEMLPLLLRSDYERRQVINTHAREGLFNVCKSANHPHTNMAKSALHQLTLMINQTRFISPVTGKPQRIVCYGVDPGWISVDEYTHDSRPLYAAPLTELDGATRLLGMLFSHKHQWPARSRLTVRHFSDVVS